MWVQSGVVTHTWTCRIAGCIEGSQVLRSASAAASQGYYACFALPLTHHSYCPNDLLRALKHGKGAPEPAIYTALLKCLRANALCPREMRSGTVYPEAHFTDIVLHKLMVAVAKEINSKVAKGMGIRRAPVTCAKGADIQQAVQFHLASSASQQEYAAVCLPLHAVLVGSEAKGVGSAPLEAVPQCMQVCGDGVLSLKARGMPPQDCVVPGILCAGEQIEVVGVALIPEAYPYMVSLSRKLSFVDEDDRQELARCVNAKCGEILHIEWRV